MKKHYDSEESLKKAIEIKFKGELLPEIWEKNKPSYSPPYDIYDLKEILKKIDIKDIKSKYLGYVNPMHIQTKIIFNQNIDLIEKDRKKIFGTTLPPFETFDQVKAWIKQQNENMNESDLLRYWYIKSPFNKEGFNVEIYKDSIIQRLHTLVNLRSRGMHLQEEQIVSFLFFGQIKPEKYILYWETTGASSGYSFGQIRIVINYPISISDLLILYKRLRSRVWGVKKNLQPLSEKEAELSIFILSKIGWDINNINQIKWDSLRKEWNKEKPQWDYENIEHFRISVKRTLLKINPN